MHEASKSINLPSKINNLSTELKKDLQANTRGINRRKALQGLAGLGTMLLYSGCNFASDASYRTEKGGLLIPRDIVITPDMQERAKDAFEKEYKEFRGNFVLPAGEGALRVVHDENIKDTSFEVQMLGELFALAQNDNDTLTRMFAYDARYKKENGLKGWLNKNDGSVDDLTAVSGVMMYLAAIRLFSPLHKAEGREMLEDIKKHSINPITHVPKAFDTDGSANLTNPSYWNPLFLEHFAKVDPYWSTVAKATRQVMDNLAGQVVDGKLAYLPNWIDMQAQPINGPGGKEDQPVINYDSVYIPIQQMQEALYGVDQEGVNNAKKQASLANRFYYNIISMKNRNGKVNGYDIERLKDGYNLDGSTRSNEALYSRTAFATAACVAAVGSEDQKYKKYMFDELFNIPTDFNFNAYIHLLALLTLSGKMKNMVNTNVKSP